jgi:hypothetical protein
MPTKVEEYSLFAPGKLVKTRKEIYSVNPEGRIPQGTIGTILCGPRGGYTSHCQVHFVSMAEPWWVNFGEIEPHL